MKPVALASRLFILVLLIGLSFPVRAQQIDTILFEEVGAFEYSWVYSALAGQFDALGRPYLYSANNELGMILYDVEDPSDLFPIDTFPNSLFGNLKVTNLFQEGQYLYLSLGGFPGAGQDVGLATLDVTDPVSPVILDVWKSSTFSEGVAIVVIEGSYAYLGGMEEGLLILDVSDKENIAFVSHILPDPNWPQPPGPFSVPNARGMAIRGDLVFVCYDAGGLRVIDVTDKENPQEVSKYINTEMNDITQPAYNNIQLVGDYAYIGVDYCGLEVVDISDPLDIQGVYWYNPWDCTPAIWSGNDGHVNELVKTPEEDLLFVSAGDTELMAFDLSDPALPKKVGEMAMLEDSAAVWGVRLHENYLVLSFIDNSGLWIPGLQPFYSDYGGIRIVEWQRFPSAVEETPPTLSSLSISPNPASGISLLDFSLEEAAGVSVCVYNSVGQLQEVGIAGKLSAGVHQWPLDWALYPSGIYLVQLLVAGEPVGATRAVVGR
ncbi:MAG: hypothetical protein KDC43_21025 [Saprospiraceae bacterium]|nr:hypothetical protein [Saprospiraceae bacterium]